MNRRWFEADLDTTLEKQRWRHRIESEIDYERKKGLKTEDTADHSLTSDYFFTETWFAPNGRAVPDSKQISTIMKNTGHMRAGLDIAFRQCQTLTRRRLEKSRDFLQLGTDREKRRISRYYCASMPSL